MFLYYSQHSLQFLTFLYISLPFSTCLYKSPQLFAILYNWFVYITLKFLAYSLDVSLEFSTFSTVFTFVYISLQLSTFLYKFPQFVTCLGNSLQVISHSTILHISLQISTCIIQLPCCVSVGVLGRSHFFLFSAALCPQDLFWFAWILIAVKAKGLWICIVSTCKRVATQRLF